MEKHYQVLIVGGGTAGIMTAAQLRRQDSNINIGLVEPSETHCYQPAWTLVGAGTFDYDATRRAEARYIPKGVDWIKDYAARLEPEQNAVHTRGGDVLHYDYLVLCPGIKLDLDALPGLREALDTDVVCSNYIDPRKTWEIVRNFKGGNAVFSQPNTPVKCGGAAQKAIYLSDSYFRKSGVRDKTKMIFATPGSVMFGVEPYAQTINQVVAKKNILLKTFYSPVKIDPVKREIYYKALKPEKTGPLDPNIGERAEGDLIVIPYDMLHIPPPQSAPDFVRESTLAVAEGPNKGWLDVDIHSLQHRKFANVFGLGDVAALPTAKTGAAVRKQAPVVVANISSLMKNQRLSEKQYEGYSSCPLVTDYGKMVLAEFKYNNVRDSDKLLSTFIDTSKEQWSMWILKKYGLPWLYWNQMLRGRM